MIGKKDTVSIFESYKQVLLEQNQGGGINDLISKIKTSSIDEQSKNVLIQLLSNPSVTNVYTSMTSQQPVGDADTAGYSSYPEATPATSVTTNDEFNVELPSKEESDERKKTVDAIFKGSK